MSRTATEELPTEHETEHETAAIAGKAIARNAGHLVMGQVVTTVLAVTLSAALGRSLGAVDFGLLFLVTSMAQFAFVVVEWGQLQYVVREVARDAGRSGVLLGSTLALRIIGAVALTVVLVLLTGALGYDAETRTLAALLMACMLPFALAQAFSLVFRGSERMEYESLVSVINRGGTLVFTIPILLFGMGLRGVFLAQAVAGLLALAVAGVFLRRLELPAPRPSLGGMRQIFVGGAPLVIMSVAISSQSYVDAIVLSKLSSPESIGWFGAAKMIMGTLIAPAMILASSAYPRLSRATHDAPTFRQELQIAIRPLIGLATLGAVGTFLFAGQAVHFIYGEESFAPAGTILQVFAPGLLLLFLDIFLGTAVLAMGRSIPLAVAKVVTVFLSAGVAAALVPFSQERFGNGGIGVAFAFCVCEFIMFATAVRLLPSGTLDREILTDGGRAIFSGALCLLIFYLLPSLPLLVGAPLCVALFLGLAMLTGLIRSDETRWILSRLARRARQQAG